MVYPECKSSEHTKETFWNLWPRPAESKTRGGQENDQTESESQPPQAFPRAKRIVNNALQEKAKERKSK